MRQREQQRTRRAEPQPVAQDAQRTQRSTGAMVAAIGGLLVGIAAVVGVLIPVFTSVFRETPRPNVAVTCNLPTDLRPGRTVTLVYNINATQPVKVGLGAGLYDTNGSDYSDGTGDVDEYALGAGRVTASRPFTVPTGLDSGRYELVAEIWPANQIGAEGVNTLADQPCGYIDIP
jgi:hypothetical protein